MRFSIAIAPRPPFSTHLEYAKTAFQEGVDRFWIGDTIEGYDPFLTLLGLSSWLGNERFGVSVVATSLYHPFVVARNILTLQELLSEPLIIGLGAGDKRSSDLLKAERSISLFVEKVRSIINFIRKGADASYPGLQITPPTVSPMIFLGTQNPRVLSSLHNIVDGYIGNTGSIHELSFLLEKTPFKTVATFIPVFFPHNKKYQQRNISLLKMVISSVSRKALGAFPEEISNILLKLMEKTTRIQELSSAEIYLLANEFCLVMEEQAVKQKLSKLSTMGVQEILLGGISPDDLPFSLDFLRSLAPS